MSGGRAHDELLRILLLNWQDRENPEAGGAEVHLHEIFGRLAARGHEVRGVVSGWPRAAARARLDGISFERVGGRYSYALAGPRRARELLARWPADVVVEDINKIPLYAPLWSRRRVVALVPHLFGGTAFREAGPPLASAVWLAERGLGAVYRRCPFQAISESTAEDLARRGIPRGRIEVIPPGIDHETYRPDPDVARAEIPTLLYVGRLKRYKGIDVLIRAVARLRAEFAEIRLVLLGRGDDRPRLEAVTQELGASDRVSFEGWVGEAEKVRWLRTAWALVYPSPKEGWGIANVEAAACRTPVVASDSPGLRESVAADESGLLVPHGDVDAWTGALRRVLGSAELRGRLGAAGARHARRFSWDRAADETATHLRGVVRMRTGEPEPKANDG